MFFSRGTVRYEERGQGYRDVEKVGKHCIGVMLRAEVVCRCVKRLYLRSSDLAAPFVALLPRT
jgi:hypothetical protein